MTKITKKQIADIKDASDMLKALGYNSPPFDPFQISNDIGIEVDQSVTTDTISRSGSISKIGEKVNIWVNPFDPEVRQRFTVAHELGHYINGDLNHQNNIVDTPKTLYRTDGHSNPCEVDANKFAAQLLMPKEHIYKQAQQIIEESENESISAEVFIDKMAMIFKVSKPAMLYRLKGFGIISSNYQL